MVRDPVRNQVVDYMGTHQHLAVDLCLCVADNGGLRLESGKPRFYEGRIAFKFPMFFSGKAYVHVWFDEAITKYRIECEVKNKFWGLLFGLVGTFNVEWEEVDPANIPKSIMPKREESRS